MGPGRPRPQAAEPRAFKAWLLPPGAPGARQAQSTICHSWNTLHLPSGLEPRRVSEPRASRGPRLRRPSSGLRPHQAPSRRRPQAPGPPSFVGKETREGRAPGRPAEWCGSGGGGRDPTVSLTRAPTEAVSAGTRGRGQRRGPGNAPWRTQTTCRGAVCARSAYATPLTRVTPIRLAQKNFAPHSPNPLAQAIGPSGPGLRSPLPQGRPSQLACGLSRCPGPALNWPADPTSSLGHRGSQLENVTALGPLPQPLEPSPQSHGAAGAGLSSLTRSAG